MDTPTQRMLKIGKASIGLIGLDIALNRHWLTSSTLTMQQTFFLAL